MPLFHIDASLMDLDGVIMSILLIAGIYLFVQMHVVWLVYRYSNNPSVVDVSWSIGIMIAGLIMLLNNPVNHRSLFIMFLLVAWALRLAGYLWFTRIRKGIVDKRYTDLSKNWSMSKALGFYFNFLFQGMLMLVIALPFLFAYHVEFVWLDWVAGFLVVTGLLNESYADYQLHEFIKRKTGGVCQVGLWRFSRHPNYFFEWLIWVGFALFGYQHALGCISFISPLVLYFIMTRLTIPITEKGSIESKGQQYLDYQKSVPMFFPKLSS